MKIDRKLGIYWISDFSASEPSSQLPQQPFLWVLLCEQLKKGTLFRTHSWNLTPFQIGGDLSLGGGSYTSPHAGRDVWNIEQVSVWINSVSGLIPSTWPHWIHVDMLDQCSAPHASRWCCLVCNSTKEKVMAEWLFLTRWHSHLPPKAESLPASSTFSLRSPQAGCLPLLAAAEGWAAPHGRGVGSTSLRWASCRGPVSAGRPPRHPATEWELIPWSSSCFS